MLHALCDAATAWCKFRHIKGIHKARKLTGIRCFQKSKEIVVKLILYL